MADERKLATVLFADLVGSTALADAAQDPERTRALLERFYDTVAADIEAAGGTIEKFAGDAVMAAFGAPEAQEDHAERALHAALAVRRHVAELFGGSLHLRIGVQSGELVVGEARAASSFVSGDAVNTAARLEQAAEPDEILVGERTAAAVQGAFEFGRRRTAEAKGKPGGIACRTLVRALSLMRPRGFGGLGRVFVGRSEELAALCSAYDAGGPGLVTVVGDAGAGKTTLIREFWEWLGGRSPEPRRLAGRCLAYGQAVTYWPLAEVLREHFGLLESDPVETALARLGEQRILGLTLGLDVGGELHPLAARDRHEEAWVDLLEKLTAERPVVLLVEDLHWAEEPLLDLLDRLARDVRGPLLLLCTARPEFRRRGGSELHLEPLADGDAGELVDRLLGGDAPKWVRELVVARAEGNPFFVEELVRMLIDQGLLERANGGWDGERPAAFTVPDSIHALVAARLDLLGADEKAALQAAAVIGRIFWSGPVYELLGGAAPELRQLEDRDFVRRRPSSALAGEREYAFKHALTREVAYGSLTRAGRARLHAAFAGWLERSGGGRDEDAPLLAHHYASAVEPGDVDLAWPEGGPELERLRLRAVESLSRAAELAMTRYELADAVDLLRKALELAPGNADLWRRLAAAHALHFDGLGLLDAMEHVLELIADPAPLADAYAELALTSAVRSGMWRTQPARERVEEWIERATELSVPESTARAKALAARAFWRPRENLESAREASRIAERLGGPELRSYALGACAYAAIENFRFTEASAWADRRLELAATITDPDHVVDAYETGISAITTAGRLREARQLARLHVELSEALSPHHRVHGVAVSIDVEELAGEWETIRRLTPLAEEIVAGNAETPCIRNVRTLLLCALASAQLGDEAGALELERAADAWQMDDYGSWLAEPRLRLALQRRDLDSVAQLLPASAEGSFRAVSGPAALAAQLDGLAAIGERARVEELAPYVRESRYLEPFALRALGLVREDDALVAQATASFESLGLSWHAAETKRLVAQA
jgi:class 3 adenylate cyclase